MIAGHIRCRSVALAAHFEVEYPVAETRVLDRVAASGVPFLADFGDGWFDLTVQDVRSAIDFAQTLAERCALMIFR